jgi:hypothetical protein
MKWGSPETEAWESFYNQSHISAEVIEIYKIYEEGIVSKQCL